MHDIKLIRKIASEYHDSWGFKYHICAVVKNALFLADKVGADKDVVEVAAYLHDLGVSKKLAGDYVGKENDHHLVGAVEAKKLLKDLNYPSDFIEKVADCILTHRGRRGTPPITIEQKVIANADAMAHFDTFLDLFNYFVNETNKSFEEGLEELYNKIKRDWELKLTIPQAKDAIRPKYDAVMLLIESMRAYV